jgi:hypothetical protein
MSSAGLDQDELGSIHADCGIQCPGTTKRDFNEFLSGLICMIAHQYAVWGIEVSTLAILVDFFGNSVTGHIDSPVVREVLYQ